MHGKDELLLKRVLDAVERWHALGRPKAGDYKVRLLPPALASIKMKQPSFIVRRKNSLQIVEPAKKS
jgi:hypothetical protein